MVHEQMENPERVVSQKLEGQERLKKGMHELLAPIVFTLHCDHQAFLHAIFETSKENRFQSLFFMWTLYATRSKFSSRCSVSVLGLLIRHAGRGQGKETLMTPIPFARPQDLGPTIAIVTKVNQIQDHLLKKHDIELYMHLNRLEIAPQIYGFFQQD
ncbi:hypothetical protein CB1_001408027 [Camelus ferus]|nr:hypothetical protein CB1_001408027 [Camelus ferus]